MSPTILRSARELAEWRGRQHQPIGMVPTMGNLHAGHLSLVNLAKLEAPVTLVTIFVNPTQFADPEDFATYPVTLESDLQQLSDAGASALFIPEVSDLYPDGLITEIEPPQIANRWEGEFRPGHFAGVCTVVNRLLQMAQPASAIFGEKDYQQLQVVSAMCEAEELSVRIVSGLTVREPDGLALSSRNNRLGAVARGKAPALYEALRAVAKSAATQSDYGSAVVRANQQLTSDGYNVEYIAVVDATTLEPMVGLIGTEVRVLGAASLDGVRLIDNVQV